MQTFAHVVDGAVREVISLDDGMEPGKDIFRPEFARELVACGEGVAVGHLYDGKGFSAPPTEPEPVPASITRAQAKIQLRRLDLREKAEAWSAKASPEAQDWYVEAATWLRGNPNVKALAQHLRMKDVEMDDFFRHAGQIPA